MYVDGHRRYTFDVLDVTFTVTPADNGASTVTWTVASTVNDKDKLKIAVVTFYELFVKILAAKFAAK